MFCCSYYRLVGHGETDFVIDWLEELNVVKTTLLVSFRTFPKGITSHQSLIILQDSSDVLFHQLENGSPLLREEACRFLAQHLLPVSAPRMKQKFLNRFLPVTIVDFIFSLLVKNYSLKRKLL